MNLMNSRRWNYTRSYLQRKKAPERRSDSDDDISPPDSSADSSDSDLGMPLEKVVGATAKRAAK